MDDHDLHLVDQNASDLRHASLFTEDGSMTEMISGYVDGDAYASAALQCVRFLFNSPIYDKRQDSPEVGLRTYAEWGGACVVAFDMLCEFLEQANTPPELVEFISNHGIHPVVQETFTVHVQSVDVCILAFLRRASVCPNWRIISAIQRSLIKTHQQPSQYAISDQDEATSHSIPC